SALSMTRTPARGAAGPGSVSIPAKEPRTLPASNAGAEGFSRKARPPRIEARPRTSRRLDVNRPVRDRSPMRQIWIPRAGPPEVLEVREAPDPRPGPGEVRVRVEAAGVNFADVSARLGTYQDCPLMPVV